MTPKLFNRNYIFAVIAAVIFSGLGVLFAMFLMLSVDAAADGNLNTLLWYLSLTVALAIGEFIVGVCFKFFTLRYSKEAMITSKNTLFRNTLKGVDAKNDNNIAMYTTNTDLVYDNYYQKQIYIVLFSSQFLFSVIGVIYLNWMLFLVSFIASLLPMFAPVIFHKRLKQTIQNYSESSKKYINRVTDSISGLREIKSFFAQNYFEDLHSKLNIATEKARASNKFIGYTMDRASSSFGSLSFVIIIGTGGFFVIQGSITIGALIAVIQLLNGMVSPIGNISETLGQLSANKELATSYFEKPATKEGKTVSNLAHHIKVENLTYAYPQSETMVLNDFNICFRKGRSYALVGESGCGKTTLAKLIANILPYEKGKILYDSLEISKAMPDDYGMKVRYISQAEHLFNISIKDNVEMGHNTECYTELLKNLGLEALLARSDEEFTDGEDLLSAGQKQRIALARALSKLPDVLILDEPTANLDIDTALDAIQYLLSFKQLTLIVITHADNQKILELFDEVIRM